MSHKLDEVEFDSRMQAQADLESAHVAPNSIPGIRDRLYLVESMIGVVGE